MKYKPLFLFALVLSFFPISGCKPNPAELMTAVKADNTENVKSLIGKGADANSRTSPNGWSALHYAARNGNVEVVQALLKAGADPNYSGSMDGQANSAAALKPLSLAQGMLEVEPEPNIIIPFDPTDSQSVRQAFHAFGVACQTIAAASKLIDLMPGNDQWIIARAER